MIHDYVSFVKPTYPMLNDFVDYLKPAHHDMEAFKKFSPHPKTWDVNLNKQNKPIFNDITPKPATEIKNDDVQKYFKIKPLDMKEPVINQKPITDIVFGENNNMVKPEPKDYPEIYLYNMKNTNNRSIFLKNALNEAETGLAEIPPENIPEINEMIEIMRNKYGSGYKPTKLHDNVAELKADINGQTKQMKREMKYARNVKDYALNELMGNKLNIKPVREGSKKASALPDTPPKTPPKSPSVSEFGTPTQDKDDENVIGKVLEDVKKAKEAKKASGTNKPNPPPITDIQYDGPPLTQSQYDILNNLSRSLMNYKSTKIPSVDVKNFNDYVNSIKRPDLLIGKNASGNSFEKNIYFKIVTSNPISPIKTPKKQTPKK